MNAKTKKLLLALVMLVAILIQLFPFQMMTAQAKTIDKEKYGSGAGVPGKTAMKQSRGALSNDLVTFFGIEPDAIVKELEKHEHDNYYLGTPYRGLYTNPDENNYLSPNGNPNSFGPGMNCTGFVAYVIKQAGGDISRISKNSTGFGGVANAYNWRDVLRATMYSDTFNSISEMLKSGKMHKGDIIYFDPDTSVTGYDSHIGFFWGDTPSENKFWHSYPEANQISEIKEKTKSEKIYVFHDVEFPEKGNIEIAKIDKDTGAYIPNTEFKATFEGEDAPESKTVKTGSDGKVTINDIPAGVKYKITETSVPKPYVLASAIGESDTSEGVVKADETIAVTARNVKATGQIVIDKSGVETNTKPWNDNYSRAGNIFEIRENDKDGKVVETITSNDKGNATSSNKLPLGTYYVSEKTAANGFANTFKPVTVKIQYKDQKTPIIVTNDKGTNQEVTGSSILTKEDEETQGETQGRASFEGAEYGLFNKKDDSPVKWTDSFKPELTNGTKVKTEDDSIVIRIDDKEQKAGVKHLPLNHYYWKETKAPEGYQLDQTKREFALTYKDQETKVVSADTTSKEKVIKLSIDGFKYLQSKSGDVQSGYNGIKFALTPTEPTKGEPVEVETKTDANGYDGYWNFTDFPYGDYKISEVAAPDGYKKINDLILKSSYDQEKKTYHFTVTEDGQKEPLKDITVEESKIHEGSNKLSLGKLMITNNLVKAPQLSTKASVDGKATFTPGKDTPMKDTVSITGVNKDGNYRLKAIKLWRIQNDDKDNAKVVFESSEDFVADAENMEKVIETKVDTSKDDANTRYVWTEKLAELDKDGKETDVADHEDLENKEQTVTPEIEEAPKTETLFATLKGEKEIDATKDQKLVDTVKQEFPDSQIGQKKHWVHKLHKVADTKQATTATSETTSSSSEAKATKTSSSEATSSSSESSTKEQPTSEVLATINDTREVKKGTEEFTIEFDYDAKKYNLKDGEKLVVTHEVFNDDKHSDKYVEHNDLNNEKQTIRPKANEPTKETPKESKETPKSVTEKTIPQTGSYNAYRAFFTSLFQ